MVNVMDPCWKSTPIEIVQHILKLACSRLIYRDNRFIEIKDVIVDNAYVLNKLNLRRLKIVKMAYDDITGAWYMEFRFRKTLNNNINHGLSFSFNWDARNTFEICYYSGREDPTQVGAWTQIRTIYL